MPQRHIGNIIRFGFIGVHSEMRIHVLRLGFDLRRLDLRQIVILNQYAPLFHFEDFKVVVLQVFIQILGLVFTLISFSVFLSVCFSFHLLVMLLSIWTLSDASFFFWRSLAISVSFIVK